MSEENVQLLMESWGMSLATVSKFIASKMDLFAIEHIDDLTLVTLIPEEGQRIRFKVMRAKWAKEGAKPPCKPDNNDHVNFPNNFMEDDDTSSLDDAEEINDDEAECNNSPAGANKRAHSSSPTSPGLAKKEKFYDLKAVLKLCKKGRDILASFNKNGALDESAQNTLVEVLIDEEQRENSMVKITVERFELLATNIINFFDGEVKQTYFHLVHHPDGASTYGGKLYRRYYNERRKSANLGLATKRVTDKDENEPPSASVEKHPRSLLFVETNAKPYNEVYHHWKITVAERMIELKKGGDKVQGYFRRFPGLLEKDGYLLLMSDFDFLHPEKEMKLLEEWPLLSEFIISSIQKKIDPQFLKDTVFTANEKILQVLDKISQLFGIITVAKKSKKTGEWKASRAQVQDGFLMRIKAIGELHEKLEEKRQLLAKYGLQQQPVPVVVGDLESPSQYLVVVDNFQYEVDSPLRAIDVTFKIYQALDAKYPAEAEHVWLFLQKAVYGITTRSDRVFTSVTSRLGEYATFKKRANKK